MRKTTVYADRVICSLGPSDSQLPRIQPPEESYYVNRHVFPKSPPPKTSTNRKAPSTRGRKPGGKVFSLSRLKRSFAA